MLLYDELKFRDLIKDVSNEENAKTLLNGKGVLVYCGFDPTGKSLTIGHLVQVMRMKLLEKHGHIPVVLIGGATGLIGDPRQTSERKLLTLEESLENAALIEQQIKKFLPNALYVNNYDWVKDIDMITFLRDYGKFFNINYMLAKDNVQARLETGISYTEFSYMIIQALDWLYLYEHKNVQIQFGGSDQWGNITSGLELIRKKLGETQIAGLSSPLLLKSDGGKFGKSESGTLWLDEALTSPYELYQYFLNTTDSDIEVYLKTLTLYEPNTIVTLIEESKQHPEKRIAQKALAEAIVEFVHGKEALKQAINVSESLFLGQFETLSLKELDMAYMSLDSILVQDGTPLIDVLTNTKLASSNREARTFITSGAVYINDKRIDDLRETLNKQEGYYKTYSIIKRGKKKFSIVKFK